MDKAKPVGIFAFNIESIKILNKLNRLLPHENYKFIINNTINLSNIGEKDIIAYAEKMYNFLADKNAKMIIIAEPIISQKILTYLKSKYFIPIVSIDENGDFSDECISSLALEVKNVLIRLDLDTNDHSMGLQDVYLTELGESQKSECNMYFGGEIKFFQKVVI